MENKREKAWAEIRRIGVADGILSAEDVMTAVKIERDNLYRFLSQLVDVGILTHDDGTTRGQFTVYRFERDPGPAFPHEINGSRWPWRRQAWQTMRILKRFSIPSLMMSLQSGSEVKVIKPNTLDNWIRQLAKAGYVRKFGDRGGRGVLRRQMYVLLRDTGPEPPSMAQLQATLRNAPESPPNERNASGV